MKKEERTSYAIYKKDLIFNTLGSFSHLDILFGNCTENGNIFISYDEPVRRDILDKLKRNNIVRKIYEENEITKFFHGIINEYQKEKIQKIQRH